MQHWRYPATDGAEFWISCKWPAFLSSFSRLQVIQNKRPWCSAAAYVTAGLLQFGSAKHLNQGSVVHLSNFSIFYFIRKLALYRSNIFRKRNSQIILRNIWGTCLPWQFDSEIGAAFSNTFVCKVEKILKGRLDLIPSPSASVKIQIMDRKVCLRCKGKTLLGDNNKLFLFISLLTMPINVLPFYLK